MKSSGMCSLMCGNLNCICTAPSFRWPWWWLNNHHYTHTNTITHSPRERMCVCVGEKEKDANVGKTQRIAKKLQWYKCWIVLSHSLSPSRMNISLCDCSRSFSNRIHEGKGKKRIGETRKEKKISIFKVTTPFLFDRNVSNGLHG